MDGVADHGKIALSIGKDHSQSYAVGEVRPGINRIASDDDAIRRTVPAALDERRTLDADHDGLTAFLDDVEYRRAVVLTILQRRRAAIETIMQEKFSG